MSRYENHNLEESTLPFIYHETLLRPRGLMFGSANWHENVELLYIVEGRGFISNNGNILSVSAGDTVMINANHLHTLTTDDCAMRYRYLIVDRSFCLANGFDTGKIYFSTQICDTAVNEIMAEIEAAYAEKADAPYRTAHIRSLVLRLMVLLCRDHSTEQPEDRRHERCLTYVKQAIDFIRASYDKTCSLDDVAAFVGVNRCYLSREFHKYTGYPFVAYVNRTRCKMAQQMLLDARLSIREVGERCGFESPSYFAKSFRRYIGMRPGEYRNHLTKTV